MAGGPAGDPAEDRGGSWRWLTASDAPAVEALHRDSLGAASDPRLVKPERPGFFTEILNGRGEILGYFEGDALLAYGVALTRLAEPEVYDLLGLDPVTSPLAKLSGSAVALSHRGRGLQTALVSRRLDYLHAKGFPEVFATAAPANSASWRNLMHGGLQIAGLVERYGGLLRFLLHGGAANLPVEPAAELNWCKAMDAEGQQRLLQHGCRGVTWRLDAEGAFDIGYAWPPSKDSA